MKRRYIITVLLLTDESGWRFILIPLICLNNHAVFFIHYDNRLLSWRFTMPVAFQVALANRQNR